MFDIVRMIVGQNVIYYYVGRRKQCRATQSVPANTASYRVGSTISLGARCSFPFPYTMSATPIRGGTLISQYATSTWLKSGACLGGSGFMSFGTRMTTVAFTTDSTCVRCTSEKA